MNNNTVKFNVGGRHFEVSRALIEGHSETMLGRLVSDAWQEDPEQTVFIDRNGDTFAHVLDYLRYGSIELPAIVPKSTFDRELDFYGLVPEEGSVAEKSIVQVAESLREEYLKAKSRHDMFGLAFEAHNQYVTNTRAGGRNSQNGCVEVTIDSNHQLYEVAKGYNKSTHRKLLQGYLGTHFGLLLLKESSYCYHGKGYIYVFHVRMNE